MNQRFSLNHFETEQSISEKFNAAAKLYGDMRQKYQTCLRQGLLCTDNVRQPYVSEMAGIYGTIRYSHSMITSVEQVARCFAERVERNPFMRSYEQHWMDVRRSENDLSSMMVFLQESCEAVIAEEQLWHDCMPEIYTMFMEQAPSEFEGKIYKCAGTYAPYVCADMSLNSPCGEIAMNIHPDAISRSAIHFVSTFSHEITHGMEHALTFSHNDLLSPSDRAIADFFLRYPQGDAYFSLLAHDAYKALPSERLASTAQRAFVTRYQALRAA